MASCGWFLGKVRGISNGITVNTRAKCSRIYITSADSHCTETATTGTTNASDDAERESEI